MTDSPDLRPLYHDRLSKQIEPRVRAVPPDISRGVKSDPDRYLPALARFLTDGIEFPPLRIKMLHDWLADNIEYDVKSYLRGKIPAQNTADCLRSGKSVCAGFSNLFEKLCTLADIECRTIAGYARGYGYRPFAVEDTAKRNHDWNAVKITSGWSLVDVTWDAGHVKGRSYEKEYSTDYLFARPEAFVHTHFPEDRSWQLLKPPLSSDEFRDRPYLRGRFFALGLTAVRGVNAVTHTESTYAMFLPVPADVSVITRLADSNGRKLPREYAPAGRTRSHVVVLVTFPRPGKWLLEVFARAGGRYGSHSLCGQLGFISSSGARPADSWGTELIDLARKSFHQDPTQQGISDQMILKFAERMEPLVGRS